MTDVRMAMKKWKAILPVCILLFGTLGCAKKTASSSISRNDPQSDLLETYQGRWCDVNGSATLDIEGDALTVNRGKVREETYRIEAVNENGNDVIRNMYGEGFGTMSELTYTDGALTAMEMILDDDGHRYRFVREEETAKEQEIIDLSENLPREIRSDEIETFGLHFLLDGTADYGEILDNESGRYSWDFSRNSDGTYASSLNAMGSSYVILDHSCTLSADYVQGLARLIQEEEIPEINGYYKKNSIGRHSYDLEVTYTSGEVLRIRAEGQAADTCVFDLEAIMDYAEELLDED